MPRVKPEAVWRLELFNSLLPVKREEPIAKAITQAERDAYCLATYGRTFDQQVAFMMSVLFT
jgi:hypothetical protein